MVRARTSHIKQHCAAALRPNPREVNDMLTKLARPFVIAAALAVFAMAPATALADKIKDSGSFEATYVKRDMGPVPDQDGHVLLLTESKGTSSNPGGLIDGFAASLYETADLRQGNGSQQGYAIYKKGADQQVVKFEGAVTTTMKDGKPNTTMKGTYVLAGGTGALAGIEGEGTYTGYFTAEDAFHVDWQGTRNEPKAAMAKSH
jgi:hypothetical protein